MRKLVIIPRRLSFISSSLTLHLLSLTTNKHQTMPPSRTATAASSFMALEYPHDDDPTSDYDDAPSSIAPQSTLYNPATSNHSSQTPHPATAAEPKMDHRKKRRNRTTQSCLSCHQNKRKVRKDTFNHSTSFKCGSALQFSLSCIAPNEYTLLL